MRSEISISENHVNYVTYFYRYVNYFYRIV